MKTPDKFQSKIIELNEIIENKNKTIEELNKQVLFWKSKAKKQEKFLAGLFV